MIRSASEPKPAKHGLLEDYFSRAELAAELGCHERTIARYEAEPDGLPSVFIGGRKFYRVADVRRFIDKRVRCPNPVRKAG